MYSFRALLLVALAAVPAGARAHRHEEPIDIRLVKTMAPPSHAVTMRVEGLDEGAIELLVRTRPAGDRVLSVGRGTVELWTTSDGLMIWLRSFLAATRRSRVNVPLGLWHSFTATVVDGGAIQQETLWRLSRPDDESGHVRTLYTPDMLWKLRPQDDHDMMALLSWRDVQKVLVRATAAIEASTIDPHRRDRVADGVRIAARVLNWLEVGGGYRRVQASLTEGPHRGEVAESSVVFLRAGVAHDLKRAQRISFPVALDAGGGSSVALHARLHTGIRIALRYGRFIGIEPLVPTYTRYRDSSSARGNPRWSYRSYLEAGVTF